MFILFSLFSLLGTLGYLVFVSHAFPSLFDPERFILLEEENGNDFFILANNGGKIESLAIFVLGAVFFDNFAALLVILTWFISLKDLATFFPDILSKRQTQFELAFKVLFILFTFLLILTAFYLPLQMLEKGHEKNLPT